LRPIAVEHDRSLAAELRVALTAYVREQSKGGDANGKA
jgi:hypothetical protein